MTGKPPALFVQRRTYRRRRLADGARILPLLGTVLFMIPLLWQGGALPADDAAIVRDGARTAWVMTYLFLVWIGLAALSGVLSRYLAPEAGEDGDDGHR